MTADKSGPGLRVTCRIFLDVIYWCVFFPPADQTPSISSVITPPDLTLEPVVPMAVSIGAVVLLISLVLLTGGLKIPPSRPGLTCISFLLLLTPE